MTNDCQREQKQAARLDVRSDHLPTDLLAHIRTYSVLGPSLISQQQQQQQQTDRKQAINQSIVLICNRSVGINVKELGVICRSV